MATNAGAGAARQLASARKATAVWKKYTVQSHGVWDRIRRALAVDPDRSNGIPLNPQYRNPPPGANPPEAYDDPVTVPAGDIAENPYYKRDIRRSYPRLSVVKQADVVGLLSVGSKANPKEDVLQIGDAGAKQLVQVKQEGEEKGLAAFFEKEKNGTVGILGPDGLPPFPSGMSRTSPVGGRKYVMDADRDQGYPEEYVAYWKAIAQNVLDGYGRLANSFGDLKTGYGPDAAGDPRYTNSSAVIIPLLHPFGLLHPPPEPNVWAVKHSVRRKTDTFQLDFILLSCTCQMVAQSVGADLRAFCNMNLLLDVITYITRRQAGCVVQIGHNHLAIGMYINYICQDFTLTATFRMTVTHSDATHSSTTAIEIILSCSICANTLSTINAEDYEYHGLRKTDDPNSGRITKLWLTECAHLCCTNHFEGGGVPFYPNQQAPRAPCPFCVVENNDHLDKTLFYINGPAIGEHDPNIPGGYFQIPPVDLGGSDPAFAALLFQYLSLIRFGAKVHEKALRLGSALRLWEERKNEIVRSLSNVAPLRDELLSAGRRLLSLGQDVTSIETVLNLAGASLIQGPQIHQRPETQQQLPNTLLTGLHATPPRPTLNIASRLASASAAELGRLTKGNPSHLQCESDPVKNVFSRDGCPAKRKRLSSLEDLEQPFDRHHASRAYGKVSSRDLMPPPPLPMRNPFVFMVNTDDNDHGESNGDGVRGEGSQGNAAWDTPQRPPSQDSARGSARRYSDTTLASETRSRQSVSSTSTAAYEGPLRHGQLNRRRAEVHGDRPQITNGEGHRIGRAQSLASQAASVSDLSDPGAPPALRNQAASRQISPTGLERSLHSRANSNQVGPASRYCTPSRERTHSTPHRQQLGSTPMARSQSDSIGIRPDETSRGRSRTPAPVPQHRRALGEQSPTPSAEAEAEDQRTPRHNRRRADR